MRLFIAEKPSLARAIAEGLGIVQRKEGYIECENNCIVTWCFGHLLELEEPNFYLKNQNEKNAGWRLNDLPIVPEIFEKKPKAESLKQLKLIKSLIAKAQEIVNSGDADREGQLLVDEVIEYCKYNGKVLRYWAQATDPTSVHRSLGEIVPNRTYQSWGIAAKARQEADWLIGMNISRIIKICNRSSMDGSVSVGRVQTPVLNLIAQREDQIANFKPQNFYNLETEFSTQDNSYLGKWLIPDNLKNTDGYLTNKDEIQKVAQLIKGKEGKIIEYKQMLKHQTPPLPFAQSDLQMLCYKLYGYSASETLQIAQKLYEEYKLTTYPRSSCQFLPSSQHEDVPKILSNLSLTFPEIKSEIDKCDPERSSKIWNDQKVNEEAHTGIIPTLHGITEEEFKKLPEECQKVYQLIAHRYIMNFLPDFTYNQTTVITLCEGQKFQTIGKNIINQGFKHLEKQQSKENTESNQEQNLPKLKENQLVSEKSSTIKNGITTPPKPFNEGTIIDAMVNIAKYLDDPDEKQLLKESKGIGTDATRAGIIETLKNRKYIIAKKGVLQTTQEGRKLLDLAPELLKSASLSAKTEDVLRDIQQSKQELSDFINAQVKFINELKKEITSMSDQHAEKCPNCGENIYRNKSKFNDQYYWYCSGCGKKFDDDNGKIGAEKIKKQLPKCPHCNKEALHHFESKIKKGEFIFWCAECKHSFVDENGQIGPEIVRKGEKCPHCGKENLKRIESKFKAGEYIHWCPDCKHSFKDQDGKIGEEIIKKTMPEQTEKCPKCKKKTCIRLPTKKDPKKFWWLCKSCNAKFGDLDGKIGKEF